jgi:signal transduction histidine kinase
MKKNLLYLFLIVLMDTSSAVSRADSTISFTILSNNQIIGMIPDVDDAYGVVFRDMNNDNYPDLYFACFRTLNRLLINNGGIIPFIDRTIHSGTGGYLMVTGNKNLELGANAADYDNDGLPDLFLAGWGKTSRLLRNTGEVLFEDATANLNILGSIDANQGLWVDVNNDGFLDLYITDEHAGNRLLLNQQNGYFREAFWTETFIDNSISQGVSHCDIDMDGDQDLYVSNWSGPDFLLINDGQGIFFRLILDLPTLTDTISTNSSTFADIDNDGDMDLLIAGNSGKIYFYKNQSDSTGLKFDAITDIPFHNIFSRVFGLLAEDFNLDGWLDLFITTNGENHLYLNNGKGAFYDRYDSDGKNAYSTGSSTADIDGDGDPDLVVSNKSDISQIYLNPVNTKDFLKLNFLGVESNRDAIGTKIFFYAKNDTSEKLLGYREITSATSYLSSREPEVILATKGLNSIKIVAIFPSGVRIENTVTQFGRSRTIREHSGLVRTWYSSIKTLKFLSRRADFWLNGFLVLLIIMFISAYLYLGLKRYYWSSFNISFQLSIWFLVSLFLFILLKTSSTYIILLTILSLAVFSIIFLTLYSENFLRQRRKRDSIRKLLQGLSEKIINIHDNKILAEEIVNTFIKHPVIKSTGFYFIKSTTEAGLLKTSDTLMLQQVELTKNDRARMLQSKIIRVSETDLAKNLNQTSNIIFPVKRKDNLYAFILLKMLDFESAINQEDIEQLTSIASQAAIAIENNKYIAETAALITQLTSTKIRAQYVKQLEQTNYKLDEKNKELKRLFVELQSKESQLIHSEKMASLGQLVAGISHELNNPISFIYTNMSILNDYVADLSKHLNEKTTLFIDDKIKNLLDELKAVITDSSNGSKSIKEIVQNLKNFSRLDEAEWKEARLSEILASCLKIVKPQLTNGIEIVTRLIDDPSFMCNPGQLNQVFLNLITNASQALKDKGEITVSSQIDDDFLVIKVHDNGPGIPQKIIKKIFDPFFTTKPVNQGTGLGLSITYGIIKKHKGNISVISDKKNGATFTIHLPMNREGVL